MVEMALARTAPLVVMSEREVTSRSAQRLLTNSRASLACLNAVTPTTGIRLSPS